MLKEMREDIKKILGILSQSPATKENSRSN